MIMFVLCLALFMNHEGLPRNKKKCEGDVKVEFFMISITNE